MNDRTKWAELQLRCRRRLAHFKGSDADEMLEALASGALVTVPTEPDEEMRIAGQAVCDASWLSTPRLPVVGHVVYRAMLEVKSNAK